LGEWGGYNRVGYLIRMIWIIGIVGVRAEVIVIKVWRRIRGIIIIIGYFRNIGSSNNSKVRIYTHGKP
jgi:hypothetical protein